MDLCDDVLLHIFSYIPQITYKDIHRLSMVSQQWNSLKDNVSDYANSEQLFREMKDDYIDTRSSLGYLEHYTEQQNYVYNKSEMMAQKHWIVTYITEHGIYFYFEYKILRDIGDPNEEKEMDCIFLWDNKNNIIYFDHASFIDYDGLLTESDITRMVFYNSPKIGERKSHFNYNHEASYYLSDIDKYLLYNTKRHTKLDIVNDGIYTMIDSFFPDISYIYEKKNGIINMTVISSGGIIVFKYNMFSKKSLLIGNTIKKNADALISITIDKFFLIPPKLVP